MSTTPPRPVTRLGRVFVSAFSKDICLFSLQQPRRIRFRRSSPPIRRHRPWVLVSPMPWQVSYFRWQLVSAALHPNSVSPVQPVPYAAPASLQTPHCRRDAHRSPQSFVGRSSCSVPWLMPPIVVKPELRTGAGCYGNLSSSLSRPNRLYWTAWECKDTLYWKMDAKTSFSSLK